MIFVTVCVCMCVCVWPPPGGWWWSVAAPTWRAARRSWAGDFSLTTTWWWWPPSASSWSESAGGRREKRDKQRHKIQRRYVSDANLHKHRLKNLFCRTSSTMRVFLMFCSLSLYAAHQQEPWRVAVQHISSVFCHNNFNWIYFQGITSVSRCYFIGNKMLKLWPSGLP